MKFAPTAAVLLTAGVLLGAPGPTRAEEILLKDGQKIVGTIIGYEKDMFRIETDFGIALVRKDKVVSIQVTKPEAAKSVSQAPPPAAASTNEVKPAKVVEAPKTLVISPFKPPSPPPAMAKPLPVIAAPAPAPAKLSAETPAVAKPPVPPPAPMKVPAKPPVAANPPAPPPAPPKPAPPPPPPVSHPLDVPVPSPIEEHVDSNTYFNDTFKFSLFKPPDWKIYEGVQRETGSGIMAMGTEDEQTLLMVDRQVWSGTPKLSSDEAEAKFRQTYQDYRRISQESVQCDGQPAMRYKFTGLLDGVEWHGVTIYLIHGNTVFGITGVTSAETFGFQEAIFAKITKSFHFLAPPSQVEGSSKP